MSILRANGMMERQDLLYIGHSTLKDIPVCKAHVDEALTQMVLDGTVEIYDEPNGGDRYYSLAHCGHDTPTECIEMGCQVRYPGVI